MALAHFLSPTLFAKPTLKMGRFARRCWQLSTSHKNAICSCEHIRKLLAYPQHNLSISLSVLYLSLVGSCQLSDIQLGHPSLLGPTRDDPLQKLTSLASLVYARTSQMPRGGRLAAVNPLNSLNSFLNNASVDSCQFQSGTYVHTQIHAFKSYFLCWHLSTLRSLRVGSFDKRARNCHG
jgi:hypothetical protein